VSLPDELCPECRGPVVLRTASPVRLRKKCLDCGHRWSEDPGPGPLLGRDGRVDDRALEAS